ncbi:MAG: hypothetical protein H0W84_09935 [Bacteroidetes bacterium]|nr:hypothetical protein [Bacteroidota bacterium]
METIDHIFDNRQFLQRIVTYGGNKISAVAPSCNHSISIEDVKRIFLQHLNTTEISIIQDYFKIQKKNKFESDVVECCCNSIISYSLNKNRGYDHGRNITLKEFFLERLLSEGCANAIILLHKHYYLSY